MVSIHAALALDLQSMTFRTLTSHYILVFGVRFFHHKVSLITSPMCPS